MIVVAMRLAGYLLVTALFSTAPAQTAPGRLAND